MKWAFIDYENIGRLSKIELSGYSKVILFLGAKQPKIDFGEKKYDSPIEVIIIQLKEIQANNLDFHLSYYLGKFDSEATKEIVFEVISNDNGFSPLIAHIKTNGRACEQIKVASASIISIISKPNNVLIDSLKAMPVKKRPKKTESLKNYIASHLRIQGKEEAVKNHFNQLIKDKVVSVSGKGIEYLC